MPVSMLPILIVAIFAVLIGGAVALTVWVGRRQKARSAASRQWLTAAWSGGQARSDPFSDTPPLVQSACLAHPLLRELTAKWLGAHGATRVAYEIDAQGRARVRPAEAPAPVGEGTAVRSPAGDRTATVVKRGDALHVECAGIPSPPFAAIHSIAFSADGRQLVYAACIAARSNQWMPVLNGSPSAHSYPSVGPFVFSNDGSRLAFLAGTAGSRESHFLFVDGEQLAHGPTIGMLLFSPDSRYIAYWIQEEITVSLWIDNAKVASKLIAVAEAQWMTPGHFTAVALMKTSDAPTLSADLRAMFRVMGLGDFGRDRPLTVKVDALLDASPPQKA